MSKVLPVIANEQDFRKAIQKFKQLDPAKYTPSLVALIGSHRMVDQLFEEIGLAVRKKVLDGKLRKRLQNLLEQFIPQIAELNSVKNLGEAPTRKEVRNLFANAKAPRMLPGENGIFLRLIHGSLKNILETIPG